MDETQLQKLLDELKVLMDKFHAVALEEAAKNKALQQEIRNLRFNLADEQDCNQHGECHTEIQELRKRIVDLESRLE